MNINYSLQMPKDIRAGKNALEQLEDVISKDVNKIVIFTDKGIKKAGLIDIPISIIEKLNIKYEIIADLPAEPSYLEAQEIIDRFQKINPDFIIGIGGGSVIDVAKLASILDTEDYTVKDLLSNPNIAEKKIRSLMIPTTAGTGAEATPNSIVLVPEQDLKVGIVNESMIADYVLLDARMIKNLPNDIAASTGVDALCHAIECFTSKKANPISDTFALRALDLIMNNIIEATINPENLNAKNNMLLGSFLAGVAITTSGTTAIHALSYPLGGKYHIPHGVSNAMLLVPVMKFNEPKIRELLAKAYDYTINITNEDLSEKEKSAKMINKFEEIVKELKIPTNLKEFEVPREDLDFLVTAGMQVERLLVNNMRKVTEKDAKEIYQKLM